MEVPLSKLNWLIVIRKLYENDEPLESTQIIKQLRQQQWIPDSFNDELFSIDELIDEIDKYDKKQLHYDDFFVIVGNLKIQQDPQQSTCVNSIADSVNDLTLSDGKNKRIVMTQKQHLSQQIHEYRRTDCGVVVKTQQSMKIRQSQSPISKQRIETIQKAQKQILQKISNIEQEIVNKQLQSLKKNQQHLLKELQSTKNPQALHIPNATSIDLTQVLPYVKCDQVEILSLTNQVYDILLAFRNLQCLSVNNNKLCTLKVFHELKQLRVFSASNNYLKSLDGIQQNIHIQELYIQGNQIQTLFHLQQMQHLTIMNASQNQIGSLQHLVYLKECKQMNFINFRFNPIAQLPEYKRILLKLFHNIKAIDRDELHQHSQIKVDHFHSVDIINFSFSQ